MLDLGECLWMDVDNLPLAVYLSPVQAPPQLNDGYFMIVRFGVRQAQISGCACLKHKWLGGARDIRNKRVFYLFTNFPSKL